MSIAAHSFVLPYRHVLKQKSGSNYIRTDPCPYPIRPKKRKTHKNPRYEQPCSLLYIRLFFQTAIAAMRSCCIGLWRDYVGGGRA